MEIKIKKICTAILTISILLTVSSCGDDNTSDKNITPSESTTIAVTQSSEKTTVATTSHSTTEFKETEVVQKTTNETKAETSQPKTSQTQPAQTKPTDGNNNSAQVSTTELKNKPTQAKPKEEKPKKETPKFIFPQSFPVKVTAFSAEYEVVKAYISDGYWYNEDTYLFVINIAVKRCDDGINEEKASAVQMKIKESNGNVVRSTSTSAGMLSIGEQGTGSMSWSVDAPGTYTIEFSSI